MIQDVRGRYHSEGLFNPHHQEIDDCADFHDWLIRQPWFNGHIGTFGRSYHAGTQWYFAVSEPKELDAMVPEVSFDDEFSGSGYQNGAKVLHDLRWTVASIIPDIMRRAREAGETVELEEPEVYHCLERIPLASEPAVEKYARYYVDWMKHSTYDDFWKKIAPKEYYDIIRVPVLNISGWYNIFISATFRNYLGMKEKGGSDIARNNSRVLIGPWTHTDFSGKLNGVDYGPEGSAEAINLNGIKVARYDHWLKGLPRKDDPEKPVSIFVMGENKWRHESSWPLDGTEFIPYYFHSAGDASIVNGILSVEVPENEKEDIFVYDPFDPVPTVGGQVILPGEGAIGPRDQREAEGRKDVLVYETPVLQEAVSVIGPLKAKLFISSDCPDTDFTVKLTDVFPDGESRLLSDGILRVRYRDSDEKTELIEPGKIYEITVDVMDTANTFLPGHKIRVSVSSSNFPRFNRNSNSGGDIAFETKDSYVKAVNTVFHDADHPSCILLPVVK